MDIGNILVISLILYYVGYFTNLFVFGQHKSLRVANVELDRLRCSTIKTLDEQKKFLDIKYPKSVPSKWTFKKVFFIIGFIIYIVLVAFGVNYVFNFFNIKISFWFGFFIVSVFPFLINYVLSFFDLDSNDLVSLIKK